MQNAVTSDLKLDTGSTTQRREYICTQRCRLCVINAKSSSKFCFLCPEVQLFWIDKCNIMSEVMNSLIKPELLLIVLGMSETSRKLNVTRQRFLSYCLITTKKLILILWKSAAVPAPEGRGWKIVPLNSIWKGSNLL